MDLFIERWFDGAGEELNKILNEADEISKILTASILKFKANTGKKTNEIKGLSKLKTFWFSLFISYLFIWLKK